MNKKLFRRGMMRKLTKAMAPIFGAIKQAADPRGATQNAASDSRGLRVENTALEYSVPGVHVTHTVCHFWKPCKNANIS